MVVDTDLPQAARKFSEKLFDGNGDIYLYLPMAGHACPWFADQMKVSSYDTKSHITIFLDKHLTPKKSSRFFDRIASESTLFNA